MNVTNPNHLRRALPARLALTVLLVSTVPAGAAQFALFGGKWLGVTKTTITFGAGWRNANPDKQLVGAGAGQGDRPEFPGASGGVGVQDDPELNFRKNELFSMPLTLTSEITLRHQSGQGIFVRVRAWEDVALDNKKVRHGSSATAYAKNVELEDAKYLSSAKFHGVDFYDAFFFGNYKLGNARLSLRLGRQALDWGESLLYPGINALNPYDAAWLTTTGAVVLNGGKLPVNRVYLNFAGSAGWALDGFYNLEFRETVTPGCGTYYSQLDNGLHPGCNVATAAGVPDDVSTQFLGTKAYYNGKLYAGGRYPNGAPDAPNATMKPSGDSGFGFSAHKFVEKLDTDLGFYFAEYTSPTPNASPVVGTNALDFGVNTMYPKQKVKLYALSAASGMRNLALYGQAIFLQDFPAQRNAPAFIEGALSGIGPYGYMKSHPNSEQPGYFPLDVIQTQLGGTLQIGELLHLSDATVTVETNLQWATNHPGLQGPHAERLGRGGNYGLAAWDQQGYACNPGPLANGIINKCEVDGFVTKFSAGYKIRAQAVLPQVGHGVTLVPVLFFNQDLTGFSPDGAIVGGRLSLGAYLRVLLRQKYYIDAGNVIYDRGAEWDPIADRGQYTLTLGINL